MRRLSKSAQIMALHKAGKTTRAIALAVYGKHCDVRTKMAYVRVVKNQRKGSGMSATDRSYLERKVASDPDWADARAKRWAAHGAFWKTTTQGRAYHRDYSRQRRLAAAAANQIG